MSDLNYSESIFLSLRRIIRAIDIHSRELGARFQLTTPQLVCMRQLAETGPETPGELAGQIYLSQATVTGIINRLEDRGLLRRERIMRDRRRVTVSLTAKGEEVLARAPRPLQDRFSSRLESLPREEQEKIDGVLKQIVEMMEAQELAASPIITTDPMLTELNSTNPENSGLNGDDENSFST